MVGGSYPRRPRAVAARRSRLFMFLPRLDYRAPSPRPRPTLSEREDVFERAAQQVAPAPLLAPRHHVEPRELLTADDHARYDIPRTPTPFPLHSHSER